MGIGNRVIGDGLGGGSGGVAVSDFEEAIKARFSIDLSDRPFALYLLKHIYPYLASLGYT